jgi:hypothetical protein
LVALGSRRDSNASPRPIESFEKCIRPKRPSGLVPSGQQANYKIEASSNSLNHGGNTMNYKTLVAASLMSFALSSAAFAQCTDCALFPDRDYLNKGAPTLASKMMAQPGGAANSGISARNARAEAGVTGTRQRHYRDANASIAGGAAPVNPGAHAVYTKNLRDSGYNPAGDFNGAGNMKVN